MNWIPIPLATLKYLVIGLLCGSLFFYGHHKGYKEAKIEAELQSKADLEEALSKQKEQQRKNQEQQAELQLKQEQLEKSVLNKTKEIQELRKTNFLQKKECQLNKVDAHKLNKLLEE